MTSSTDVRDWAREQGREVKERGPLPRTLLAEYEAAHPGPQPVPPEYSPVKGTVVESSYPDLDAGVTAADFPPGDYGDGEDYPAPGDGDGGQAPAAERRGRAATGERRPRKVGPPRGPGLWDRLMGRAPKNAPSSAGKSKRAAPARVPLGDFAEETWTDLAWLAQPIPPLAEMLTLQAPYAGVVFEQQVKGTVVDGILQPVARHADTFRAVSGLVGPPVYVAAICATGRMEEVPVIDRSTGQQAVIEGKPVTIMAYDARTQMLFTGLRYSLLQMVKISDRSLEEIEQRATTAAENNRKVDAIINRIFGTPAAPQQPQPPAAPAPPPQPGPPAELATYTYPDPGATAMTLDGADPHRGMMLGRLKSGSKT